MTNTSIPGHYVTHVVENRELSRRYYLLVLARPRGFEEAAPGSFVHLQVPGGARFFLRRPFSILDCDKDTISLIIVEKGEGTQALRRLERGDAVDVMGPVGNSFPRADGRKVLALAGGVGLAPLYYYWAGLPAGARHGYRLLYGARSREDLFVDRFDWDEEQVLFSTDDGSYGFEGTVIDLAVAEFEREPADVVFSCGPTPMLQAVARFAGERGVPHFVALENRMACALGACRSCVVLTREGDTRKYKTVCHDGPVFDSDTLVWELLPKT